MPRGRPRKYQDNETRLRARRQRRQLQPHGQSTQHNSAPPTSIIPGLHHWELPGVPSGSGLGPLATSTTTTTTTTASAAAASGFASGTLGPDSRTSTNLPSTLDLIIAEHDVGIDDYLHNDGDEDGESIAQAPGDAVIHVPPSSSSALHDTVVSPNVVDHASHLQDFDVADDNADEVVHEVPVSSAAPPTTLPSAISSTDEETTPAPHGALWQALVSFISAQLSAADPTRHLPIESEQLFHTADWHNVQERGVSIYEFVDTVESSCDEPVPDVISSRDIAPVDSSYHLSLTSLERQNIYSGYDETESTDQRPCLNVLKDSGNIEQLTHEFDVDSLVIVSDDLAILRQGLLWYPVQGLVPTLTTGLHLSTYPVYFTDDHGHEHQWRVPLHTIPNYCCGRLSGADEVTVNWVFPHLYKPMAPQQRSLTADHARLTQEQCQKWTDRVLLPSIQACLPTGRTQHLPHSYHHALYNSQARYSETRSKKSDVGSRQQNLQYEIPAQYLDALQQNITDRCERPGLRQFRGAFLVVQGKGLKLKHWKSPSWLTTSTLFQEWLATFFHLDRLDEDQVYIDIGRETLPLSSVAHGLLWREDFLNRLFRQLSSLAPPDDPALKFTFYPWALIGGVGAATIELPLKSHLRRQGLCYVQYYGSIKEVLAAGNTYPFSNPNLLHLSVNDRVSHIFQAIGGSISVNPDTLRKAYQHTKLRCHHAFLACEDQPYGGRFEYRVTLRLFRGLDTTMSTIPALVSPSTIEQTTAWVTHQTATLLAWKRWNINKFCFGFESILSMNADKAYIPWESTRAMILFLQCVACFVGVLRPGTFPQLWRARYQNQRPGRPGRTQQAAVVVDARPPRYGLGMGLSLKATGYGWILNRFDWSLMIVQPQFSQSLGTHRLPLIQNYHQRYQHLRVTSDSYVHIQASGNWLRRWRHSGVHLELIGRLLHQLCLRSFHHDVYRVIRPFVKKEYHGQIKHNQLGLSFDWLATVIHTDHALIKVMSSAHIKVCHFLTLCQWLFEDTGTHRRGAWAKCSFRLLYSVAHAVITEIVGEEYANHWRQGLWKTLERTCWLLPYPNHASLVGFTTRNGQRHLQWWSNYNKHLAQHLDIGPQGNVALSESHTWPRSGWRRADTRDLMRGRPHPDFSLARLSLYEFEQRLEDLPPSVERLPLLRSIEESDNDDTVFLPDVSSDPPWSSSPSDTECSSSDYREIRRLKGEYRNTRRQYDNAERRIEMLSKGRAALHRSCRDAWPVAHRRPTAALESGTEGEEAEEEEQGDITFGTTGRQHPDTVELLTRYQSRIDQIEARRAQYNRTLKRLYDKKEIVDENRRRRKQREREAQARAEYQRQQQERQAQARAEFDRQQQKRRRHRMRELEAETTARVRVQVLVDEHQRRGQRFPLRAIVMGPETPPPRAVHESTTSTSDEDLSITDRARHDSHISISSHDESHITISSDDDPSTHMTE